MLNICLVLGTSDPHYEPYAYKNISEYVIESFVVREINIKRT